MYDIDDEELEYVQRPNKSQLKRDLAELKSLAKNLAGLDMPTLTKLQLPADLYTALIEVKSMKHHAEKRHFKFITKILRLTEPEQIVQLVATIQEKKDGNDKSFHLVERWRDRIINDGQTVITELMDVYPQADAGQIRQLLRNINREIKQGKAPKSSRLLFRLLKETITVDERHE